VSEVSWLIIDTGASAESDGMYYLLGEEAVTWSKAASRVPTVPILLPEAGVDGGEIGECETRQAVGSDRTLTRWCVWVAR
jgi:hypothetical protein